MNRKKSSALIPASVMFCAHWLILYLSFVVWRIAQGISPVGFIGTLYDRLSVAGDIPHYVNIATNGYSAIGENANEIVFFPLYPMLMRFVHYIIPDYVVCGVIVSCVCMFIGNVFFFRLVEEEYDRKRAWESLTLLTCFPVAFFMCGAYTESLFILLTAIVLYCLQREHWPAVGVFGLLAALSRSQGVVLLVPAVYELLLCCRKARFRLSMLWVMLIPFGSFCYLLLNRVIYGSWTAFIAYQAAAPWYNTSHWISENLASQYGMAISQTFLTVIIYAPQLILYFTAIFILFAGCRHKVRTSFVAYGGAYLFMTYLHGWMISGFRYMLSCLPIYIILCARKDNSLRRVILAFSAALAVFFGIWYLQGQAIM